MKKSIILLAASSLLLVMASCNKLDPSVDPNDLIPSIGGFDYAGASLSQFSVSDSHAVRFSRGNLQYNDSLQSWVFAEHQYDYIGLDDTNIAPGYRGWIDLFGFGTSGKTVAPTESSTGAENYPEAIVYINENFDLSGNDWGVYNAIDNGGEQAGKWRTLTKDEWDYLLFTRAASTLGKVENARFAKATVGDVAGLMLFPDTFHKPDGFAPVINVNMISAAFTDNVYNLDQWAELEAIGVIFLPTAGQRYGKAVEKLGTHGSYWTSTHSATQNGFAYSLTFSAEGIGQSQYYNSFGRSVRLVHD